jgi:hypothetical protein
MLDVSVPEVAGPFAHNVVVCGGRGIGGLGNEAKRNAKTDQLRPVPRHNVNKETESNEDTEPPPDTNLMLGAAAFVSLFKFKILYSVNN